MYGIKGIKVKLFDFIKSNNLNELNDFLNEHDGNIIDIQYQCNNCYRIMVVYKTI